MSCTGGTARGIGLSPSMALMIPQAPATARTKPRNVPMRAIITDSHRMALRTCGRVIPTARSRPSSRRRSCTDRARVLAMPMRAMTIASPSSP